MTVQKVFRKFLKNSICPTNLSSIQYITSLAYVPAAKAAIQAGPLLLIE